MSLRHETCKRFSTTMQPHTAHLGQGLRWQLLDHSPSIPGPPYWFNVTDIRERYYATLVTSAQARRTNARDLMKITVIY